jgi:hypothetical protein
MVETYRRLSMKKKLDPDLAMEAKALVVLAFRNGPIEDLHAGKPCAVCSGKPEVSHLSDDEMKVVMKSAVRCNVPPPMAARLRSRRLQRSAGVRTPQHHSLG